MFVILCSSLARMDEEQSTHKIESQVSEVICIEVDFQECGPHFLEYKSLMFQSGLPSKHDYIHTMKTKVRYCSVKMKNIADLLFQINLSLSAYGNR